MPAQGAGRRSPLGPRRWVQLGRSDWDHEQEGLDFIRGLMPETAPYRAWATFSFTARTGHIRECDVFIVTRGGLYLVELKAHPGRVQKRGDTFVFYGDRVLQLRDPLPLLNRKCKELKSELEQAARNAGVRLPMEIVIKPAVFLTDRNLKSQLDDQQRVNLYGRDDRRTGLPRIWADLLDRPPTNQRITESFSDTIHDLMDRLSLGHTWSHLRVGKWTMERTPLESGPTWEDRVATCPELPDEKRRVRVYLSEQQAGDDRRRSTLRAAQREYQVLQGITHRGIVQAVDFEQHEVGPVVLFRHHDGELHLDQYIDLHGPSLSIDTRLDVVRQLAEAVQYAHRRHLYHQALAARSVFVTCRDDGSHPTIRIGDWQTAARDADSVSPARGYLRTNLTDTHVESAARMYLAPEWQGEYPDPVLLDVYGLGAITHLVFTNRAPAADAAELDERLRVDQGLRPSTVVDGTTLAMDRLVREATRVNVYDRTDSAEAFLKDLDFVEEELTAPDQPERVDPLEAVKGQVIEGWKVVRNLGKGATAMALLVERPVTGPEALARSEAVEQRVLKVALDRDKADRLYDEAAVLREVGGGTIVRLREGPLEIAERTAIFLEFAGERSLAKWLKDEDPPTLEQIDRFSSHLLTALDALDDKGIWHRDIKPDNLGVYQNDNREYGLKLYDFSHSRASERDIHAGTGPYLDPFMGTPRRPHFDGFAERYAAGVTLYQLVAQGQRPIWGDGLTPPRQADDDLPHLATELFEEVLRGPLLEFFERCFHRDHGRRFSRMRDMHNAWRAIMALATRDATSAAEQGPTEGAEARQVALDTPLTMTGLSPRAVSAAVRLGATTIGELLAVPPYQITRVRGAGNKTKGELNKHWRQWRADLGAVPLRGAMAPSAPEPPGPPTVPGPRGTADDRRPDVDELAELVLGPRPRSLTKAYEAVRVTLGLPDESGRYPTRLAPWPVQKDVAEYLGTSQPTVSNAMVKAIDRWFAEPRLAEARTELAEILTEAGRVMEASELAAELRARRGARSHDADPELAGRRAAAVVHALVEAERRRGELLDPGQGDGQEPRYLAPRWGDRILVALDSLDDETVPTADDLRSYAKKLGDRADEVAAADPLSPPEVVLRELRAVAVPEGAPRLADSRLVRLAAAASATALVSQRSELYPHDLALTRALVLTKAGAFVGKGLAPALILERVRSRFPDLEIGYVDSFELGQALAAAGFELEYHPTSDRFVTRGAATRSFTSLSRLAPDTAWPSALDGADPRRRLTEQLAEATRRGGFRALSVDLRYTPEAASGLTAMFDAVRVDMGELFLGELRALVDERGIPPWETVLEADRELTATGVMPPGFASYVAEVWQRVENRLRSVAGPSRVLLLTDVGPLARYEGGMRLLAELRNAARRSGDQPYGLWVLCPTEEIGQRPRIDGHIVEAEKHEWVKLDGAFVGSLAAAR